MGYTEVSFAEIVTNYWIRYVDIREREKKLNIIIINDIKEIRVRRKMVMYHWARFIGIRKRRKVSNIIIMEDLSLL